MVSGETHFLVYRVPAGCNLTRQKGNRALRGLLVGVLTPFRRGLLSRSSHLPVAPPPNTIIWGRGSNFQHTNFGRTQISRPWRGPQFREIIPDYLVGPSLITRVCKSRGVSLADSGEMWENEGDGRSEGFRGRT